LTAVRVIYTTAIRLYALGVRIAARFGHAKAKQWVEGRKSQGFLSPSKGPTLTERSFRQAQRPEVPEPVEGSTEQWIWFHAASLGEFEQGRPVIEALKENYPQFKILLSFFSPSGYEIRKNYPLADEVLYLPTDTPRHAAQWVQRHHFVAAFFIKYEFWFNYMRALKEASIPLFYISLILKPDSYFFRWYGSWFRKQLQTVSHFFVQDETTANLLKDNGMNNVTVCGDTRFDRVAAIARQVKPFPEIERFIQGRKCIIAGSTWPPDEQLLAGFLPQLPDDYCLIIAPHDVSASHVAKIKAMFPESVCYTELEAEKPSRILIVNTIGILSQLYQYARFVYIGGGFGVNIHNIQEPVTFGCPVVFGPKYKSFKEAVDLVGLQGAFSVRDGEELRSVFTRLMDNEAFFNQASQTCRDYLKSQVGATEIILKGFKKALFS
jgi:3-deoxy-D-manno-octulosonic-acid transferase